MSMLRVAARAALAVVVWWAGAMPVWAAVDVNSADEATLTSVRGIGPAMARRILEAREQGGAFRDVDDLADRVAGVGPKSAANLQSAGLTFGKSASAAPLPGRREARGPITAASRAGARPDRPTR